MPGNYSAESPSLFGNTGGPLAPRYSVDVPGAINALVQGTGSIIHNIYARKQAQRQQQIEQQHYDQQAGWHQEEVARQREHDQIEQQRYERDAHRQDLINGITPASTSTVSSPGATLPSVAPVQSPIASAMGAAPKPTPDYGGVESLGGAPAVQATPNATPLPAATNVLPGQSATVSTPESYDPTKAMPYLRQVESANILAGGRQAVAQTNAASREKTAQIAASARRYMADKRADGAGKSGVGKAMTGNAWETRFEKVEAPGFLEANDNDPEAAWAAVQSDPNGADLIKNGFSKRHLYAAKAAQLKQQEKAANQQQASGLSTPEESVGNVKKTGQLVRGGKSGADPKAEQRAAWDAAAATLRTQKKDPVKEIGARP